MLKLFNTKNCRTQRIIKQLDFNSDSQGIINRFINVEGAWQNHLLKTRQFILSHIEKRKPLSIAVFGSGWLLDFPLEEVAQRSEVILYDVVHPAQILHKIRNYPKVRAITFDITGGALAVGYDAVRQFKKNKVKPETSVFDIPLFEISGLRQVQQPVKADLYISLNILSQLSDLLLRYLNRYIPFDDKSNDLITSRLQKNHLDFLKRNASLLITDVREHVFDKENHIQSTHELIKCPIKDLKIADQWEWNFDPVGDYHSGCKTVSEVYAVEF